MITVVVEIVVGEVVFYQDRIGIVITLEIMHHTYRAVVVVVFVVVIIVNNNKIRAVVSVVVLVVELMILTIHG